MLPGKPLGLFLNLFLRGLKSNAFMASLGTRWGFRCLKPVLFYLLFCVRLFPLFIRSLCKLDGNCVQLVILVAIGTARPWGVRSV